MGKTTVTIKHSYQFDDSATTQISRLLSVPQKICIITHANPDGDAIGSSLALSNLLLRMNHEVSVVTPNQMMEFLNWMTGADEVISFADEGDIAIAAIQNAEIIFCLDFNNLSRIDGASDYVLSNQTAVKILIDHHNQLQSFCQFIFSFPEACATAELVFCFIQNLGLAHLIDSTIAECLYCGIMTDSGNFRFNSVTPELHEISAELLRRGVNQNKVYELVFDSNSIRTMKLHGYVMSEKMEYIEESKCVIISLSDEEQKRFNAGKTEIDDVVNFGLKLQGAKVSAFFYENDGKVRASFRSKGDFSVKDIAGKYFNGGGHLNAAGGVSSKNIVDTVSEFKKILTTEIKPHQEHSPSELIDKNLIIETFKEVKR